MQRARLAPLVRRPTKTPAAKPARRRKRRSRRRKGDAGIDGLPAMGRAALGVRLDPAPQGPSVLRTPVVAGTSFGSALESARASGARPLPGELLKSMARSFDTDFSDVRIHADARAGLLSGLVRARAFTVGRDVFFKPGAFSPSSAEGRRLIGHELAHVAQQADTGRLRLQRTPDPSAPELKPGDHAKVQTIDGDNVMFRVRPDFAEQIADPNNPGGRTLNTRGNLLNGSIVTVEGVGKGGWLVVSGSVELDSGKVETRSGGFVHSSLLVPVAGGGTQAKIKAPPRVNTRESCGLKPLPKRRAGASAVENANLSFQAASDAQDNLNDRIPFIRGLLRDLARSSGGAGKFVEQVEFEQGVEKLDALEKAVGVPLGAAPARLTAASEEVRRHAGDLEHQPEGVAKFTDCIVIMARVLAQQLAQHAVDLEASEETAGEPKPPAPAPTNEPAPAAPPSGPRLDDTVFPRMEIEIPIFKTEVPAPNTLVTFNLKFKGEAQKDDFTAIKVTPKDLRVEAVQRFENVSSSWVVKQRSDGQVEFEASAKVGNVALKCSVIPTPVGTANTCKVETDALVFTSGRWTFRGKLTGEVSIVKTREQPPLPPLPPIPIRPPGRFLIPGRRFPVPVKF